MSSVQQFYPAFIAVTSYLTIIFLAEVSRKVVDLFTKENTAVYRFLIELIAVAQQCTCVYENAVIIRHYGPLGFFFAVFGILLVTSKFNRGAFGRSIVARFDVFLSSILVSPLMPIELWYYNTISTEKLLIILSAQAVGGYSAFRIVNNLWYYTLDYSSDHAFLYRSLPCAINYKVQFIYVLGFEILGCFLIRLLIPRVSEAHKRFVVPMIMATSLSFALSNIGVPGLNPVTTASRLQGCPGLDLQWFLATYWVMKLLRFPLSYSF